jgi:hypothetical protein
MQSSDQKITNDAPTKRCNLKNAQIKKNKKDGRTRTEERIQK